MKAKLVSISIVSLLISVMVAVSLAIWGSSRCYGPGAKRETKQAAKEWFEKEIQHFRTADAQKDAAAAVSRGDTNYYGVMGIGLLIPGITNQSLLFSVLEQKQYRVIPGTSDTIFSKLDQEYNYAANDYAKVYNQALEKLISTNRLSLPSNP